MKFAQTVMQAFYSFSCLLTRINDRIENQLSFCFCCKAYKFILYVFSRLNTSCLKVFFTPFNALYTLQKQLFKAQQNLKYENTFDYHQLISLNLELSNELLNYKPCCRVCILNFYFILLKSIFAC